MSDSMNDPFLRPRSDAPDDSALAHATELARERAIRVLSDGYAYDALTEDEFEWRLGQLSHANTPSDVQALIADLPSAGADGTPAAGRFPSPLASSATGEERVTGFMSEVRREGIWQLPTRLRVSAVMSSVRIDLRQAIIPPGCTIEVRAIMGNVSIIAPPGLPVQFDVTPVMGTARNDSTRIPAAFGAPLVRVTGRAVMAEVRVRVRDLRY